LVPKVDVEAFPRLPRSDGRAPTLPGGNVPAFDAYVIDPDVCCLDKADESVALLLAIRIVFGKQGELPGEDAIESRHLGVAHPSAASGPQLEPGSFEPGEDRQERCVVVLRRRGEEQAIRPRELTDFFVLAAQVLAELERVVLPREPRLLAPLRPG